MAISLTEQYVFNQGDLFELLRQLAANLPASITSEGRLLVGVAIDVRAEDNEYPFHFDEGVSIHMSSRRVNVSFILRYNSGRLEVSINMPLISETRSVSSVEGAVQVILRWWDSLETKIVEYRCLKRVA